MQNPASGKRDKPRGHGISLPGSLWDDVDRIAREETEGNRSEVVERFIRRGVSEWMAERARRVA